LPRLATATTIPGNRPAARSVWTAASSRDRRAEDIPTLSGDAVGKSAAVSVIGPIAATATNRNTVQNVDQRCIRLLLLVTTGDRRVRAHGRSRPDTPWIIGCYDAAVKSTFAKTNERGTLT
jgi:hypothetical protein